MRDDSVRIEIKGAKVNGCAPSGAWQSQTNRAPSGAWQSQTDAEQINLNEAPTR